MIDTHSKWLEVIPMSISTIRRTFEELRDIFSRFDLPSQLVSDNEPQLTPTEFQEFLKSKGSQTYFGGT